MILEMFQKNPEIKLTTNGYWDKSRDKYSLKGQLY